MPANLNQRVQDNALPGEKFGASHEEHGGEVVAPNHELLMRARGTVQRDHGRGSHNQCDLVRVHKFLGDREGIEADVREEGREASPLEDQEDCEEEEHENSEVEHTFRVVVGVLVRLKEPHGVCIVMLVEHRYVERLSKIS